MAKHLQDLSQYHCKYIHQWEGGAREFHEQMICSCNTCDEDGDLKCDGSPHKTKCPLKCEFHWLAYRIECKKGVEEASSVIHPEL